MNYLSYLLIIGFELSALWYFARQGFHWLNVLLIANMIVVTMFAPILLHFPFGISNAGNLFYAFIPIIQFLIVKNYGSVASRRTMRKTLLVLSLIFMFRLLIVSIDETFVVNQATFDVYQIVLSRSYFMIMVVSFLSFWTSFWFFLEVVRKIKRKTLSYLVGMAVWQFIDSLIFFPALFLNKATDLANVGEYLLVGFAVKIIIGIIATPMIYVKENKEEKI